LDWPAAGNLSPRRALCRKYEVSRWWWGQFTGPPTAKRGQAITITGNLSITANGILYSSPYASGQTLAVTRFDPAHPNGVALPHVTTAADGSFSFTDTPPKANMDTGTVTYQVSYAGDAHLSASTGSTSVTVHYNGS